MDREKNKFKQTVFRLRIVCEAFVNTYIRSLTIA